MGILNDLILSTIARQCPRMSIQGCSRTTVEDGPERMDTSHDVLLCISAGSARLFSTERFPSGILYWRLGGFDLLIDRFLQATSVSRGGVFGRELVKQEPQKFGGMRKSLLDSIVACSIAWL
jgi:hypothetical protein